VAGLAGVGAEMALRSAAPPHLATVWSAFVAGILGGILYGVLGRLTQSPAPALWVITLVIATIDSALIWAVPFPSGRSPSTGVPIVGLVVPARQLLALAGMGHLGTQHLPAQIPGADCGDPLPHGRRGLAARPVVGRTEEALTDRHGTWSGG
jgi:predicted lipid-binding transport protein (Tim44 family)